MCITLSLNNRYTGHQICGTEAAEHERFYLDHVQQDCQLRTAVSEKLTQKTSGLKVPSKKTPTKTSALVLRCPHINAGLHKVIRSINLEDCIERVEIRVSAFIFLP